MQGRVQPSAATGASARLTSGGRSLGGEARGSGARRFRSIVRACVRWRLHARRPFTLTRAPGAHGGHEGAVRLRRPCTIAAPTLPSSSTTSRRPTRSRCSRRGWPVRRQRGAQRSAATAHPDVRQRASDPGRRGRRSEAKSARNHRWGSARACWGASPWRNHSRTGLEACPPGRAWTPCCSSVRRRQQGGPGLGAPGQCRRGARICQGDQGRVL